MNGTWGDALGVTIYGESHGKGIGVVITQIPPGLSLDHARIRAEMDRRKPGTSTMVTPRKEADAYEVLSGEFEGKTTGAPLAILIRNTNQRSKDYGKTKDILRPGHADWTALFRYKGFQDYRGGGHFSGRLTAGLVFAGAVAKQVLTQCGITIGAYIEQVQDVKSSAGDSAVITAEQLQQWVQMPFPVAGEHMEEMKHRIEMARAAHDSVGGTIRCMATGVPAGLGRPFFESMESRIAHLSFAVPAVKGIAFGAGFNLASIRGSEANDPIIYADQTIQSTTNQNGGILGGITNGMPVDFTVCVKPTPSIGKPQLTINHVTKEEVELQTEGRHDPCILPRAVPVMEAVMAIALLDAMLAESRDMNRWRS